MMAASPLLDLIRQEVRSQGPMTFAKYMEYALYHPDYGYYQRKARIGKEGDFYTSPHVNALFGRLVGKQLLEMWEHLGRPADYRVLELGAGPGHLAGDILDFAEADPDFRSSLDYLIIEISQKLREEQQARLPAEVTWLDSINDIPDSGLQGCVLSNEFVDSFPVHRVAMVDAVLRELYVGEEGDELVEQVGDLSDEALRSYFEALEIHLPEGIRTEVNLRVSEWVESIARVLRRGFVLTIDYGLPAADYYSSSRMNGTIRSYGEHRLYDDPLAAPGERDLTAHVDFTTLAMEGEARGLETLGFTDQMHFLMGIGEKEIQQELGAHGGPSISAARRRSSALNLIHPEMMGGAFRVLIQGSGVEAPPLSGLKNARGRLR